MTNFISRIRFRFVFPFLLVASLFTLPSAVTESKYVWEEQIDLKLDIKYNESMITSLLSTGALQLNLNNIQAVSQPDGGLKLSAYEGYELPETITVQIGSTYYYVHTSGLDNPTGISFNPITEILSISSELLMQSQGNVTVIGTAVPVTPTIPNQPVENEPATEGDTSPNGSSSTDGAGTTGSTPSTDTTPPASENGTTDSTPPTDTTPPASENGTTGSIPSTDTTPPTSGTGTTGSIPSTDTTPSASETGTTDSTLPTDITPPASELGTTDSTLPTGDVNNVDPTNAG